MKKSLSILVLSIFFISILVSAQSNETNITIPKINPKDPTPKIDEKLEKEITIPLGLRNLARFGLGINPNEGIAISKLITIIALWILIFIISLSATKAIPSLNQITSLIIALCVTLLVSFSRGLVIAADNWLFNERLFIFIDGWRFGNLIITIIAISLAIALALYIKKIIKKEIQTDKEERTIEKIKYWFSSLRKKE